MTTHFSAKSNHGAKSQVFESFNFVVEDAEDHIRLIRKKRDQLNKDLEEQIRLLTDRTYRPVRYTWRSDVNGNVRKVEVPLKIKQWWLETLDGTIQLSVFYKGRAIELRQGRRAIKVDEMKELVPTLQLLQLSVKLGDFDNLV